MLEMAHHTIRYQTSDYSGVWCFLSDENDENNAQFFYIFIYIITFVVPL